MNKVDEIRFLPGIGPLLRYRFLKFGIVGFSGTIVNLAVLYLNQEIFLKGIFPADKRLHLSLAGAVFLATLNNYIWNRAWTWGDRKGGARHSFFPQMGRYYLACGVAIFFQYLFTTLFAKVVHYLMANIMAIVLAAIFAYVLNDIWTFTIRRF
ncbi:MAG: GtrA family protein [Pseudomonadota bacterium]